MKSAEEVLHLAFRNADSVILDLDQGMSLITFRTDRDHAPFGRKLDRIGDEIENNLFHARGIGKNGQWPSQRAFIQEKTFRIDEILDAIGHPHSE